MLFKPEITENTQPRRLVLEISRKKFIIVRKIFRHKRIKKTAIYGGCSKIKRGQFGKTKWRKKLSGAYVGESRRRRLRNFIWNQNGLSIRFIVCHLISNAAMYFIFFPSIYNL